MSSFNEIPGDEVNDCRLLTQNYLAAYQKIKLSKACKSNENTQQDHRRITMALKYHIARHTLSETAALSLLNKDLDDYDKDRVTAFESDMQANSSAKPGSTNKKFESNLKTTYDVLQHLRPLPCQCDPLKTCKKSVPVDRDIENLIKYFDTKKELASSRPPDRTSRPTVSEEEIAAKKQEKREQFTELFHKYSRKHPKYPEDDEAPLKPIKREVEEPRKALVPFKSARDLNVQEKRKAKKTLGGKTSVNSPFVLPLRREKEEEKSDSQEMDMEVEDERLKNIDPKMVELIRNEIMDSGSLVKWEDVAGLEDTKTIIKEVIVYPMLRPDIFQGLRRPPKGILLFGPPGTGKTLIGKCIASQSNSTFFSISASSLTSKWVGEGEKMVRALFAVARVHQPAVIFIDEIDSLLTQRSETEHESSRRIKTEFLVQLDGAATAEDDRILVIGATNRPHELDEAARRRFVKRLYVPLPEHEARKQIVVNLLRSERHDLTDDDVDKIAAMTKHYSGADMAQLCKEASMEPIRSIPFELLKKISKDNVRGVTVQDFQAALASVRPSVSQADLAVYVQWDSTYGSGTADKRR